MAIKVYEYPNCSTCKRALKFLDSNKVNYKKINIVENPPTTIEIKAMLKFLKADGKTIKNIFNTSGQVYRDLNMTEHLKTDPTEASLIELLAKNGKLIKRPFIISDSFGVTGFNEDVLQKLI